MAKVMVRGDIESYVCLYYKFGTGIMFSGTWKNSTIRIGTQRLT